MAKKTVPKGVKVVLLMGYPASGKSTIAQEYVQKGHVVLNRDTMPTAKVIELVPWMIKHLSDGKNVILDNTYPTAASRQPFISTCQQLGVPIQCVWLNTRIEDAQVNACLRMVDRRGKVLTPDEIKKAKDPNIFPPAVLFKYRKEFEVPNMEEGFTSIGVRNFERVPLPHTARAVLVDYDGTLRVTKSGAKWPSNPKDIKLLPNRAAKLRQMQKNGYAILGVSNQSGIAKGNPTDAEAQACFDATNALLGMKIPYLYCPHRIPPVSCYCRKPMCGMGIEWVMKHQLDPAQVIMVGDQTSDKTFASRCGFQYEDARRFFR